MTAPERTETAPRLALMHESVRREVLENDDVLVIETTYRPGGSVPMHTHRFPHVAYVVQGGRLEITAPDGSSRIVEVHPGQTEWRTPQSHSTRNVGSSPVQLVEIEIKCAR